MKFAIIYSEKDPAGTNIVEQIKKTSFLPQTPIIKIKKHPIYADDLLQKHPKLKNKDFLIFASTHKSEKNKKTLSLHAPGNWRSADLGGKPGKISMTSAFVLKYLFKELNKNAEPLKDKYNITLECTHHGPSLEIPCCFIEIGSTEKEYKDKEAAKVIAKTIASLQNFKQQDYIPSIAIGGPHYCNNFNKIQLKTKYAISHIIPKYQLPLTETMLKQAEEKTKEQIKMVILDWKGCGASEQRQQIINLLNQFNIPFKRTNQIQKNGEQKQT